MRMNYHVKCRISNDRINPEAGRNAMRNQAEGNGESHARSSKKGRRVDALAQRADERRDKLR